MKSKIAIVLLLIFLLSIVAGCGSTYVEEEGKNENSMFVIVERTNGWWIVYHKDTKVMYAISNGHYNGGTFTMLVNADGSPQIWKGE